MKKKVLFLGVLLFVLTASVNAQVYVGGTLGISAENYKTEGKSYTNSVYSISPEIGYNINQHWAVGASLGLFYSVSGGGGDDINGFGFSPYVRGTFAQVGAVRFFTEAAFSYEKAELEDYDMDGWGVALRPGILVDLSKRLQLVGRTQLFSYSEAGEDSYKVKKMDFAISNNWEIGVLFNF